MLVTQKRTCPIIDYSKLKRSLNKRVAKSLHSLEGYSNIFLFRSVPVYFRWLQAISYFKYSYEAESLVFWSRIDSIPCKPTFQNETCVANGEEVLESLGMANGDLVVDIIVLIGMIIIYRFLAYISLLIRSYRQ